MTISKGTRHSPALYAIFSSAFLPITLVATGVPPVTSVLLTLLVAWQTLGGFIVWRSIRPHSTPLELLGMGIAIGTAMAALTGLLTSTVGWGPWGCLLPTLGALAFSYRTRGTHAKTTNQTDRWEVSAFLATVAAGLAVFWYAVRSYPLTWTGTWTGYHPDMAFFEALANSLARFGAFESPFMSGGVVRYHWLSYAWSGQLAVITDAAPFVGITRVLPLVTLLGSAAIIIAWTRRMSSISWTPLLAGALLTVSGFVGAVFGGILTLDSPSQAMSTLWLLAFTVTALHLLSSPSRWPSYALLALLAASITAGKVSAAAPALAGVLLTVLVLRIRGEVPARRAIAIIVVTAFAMLAAFALFIAGSAGGGGLQFGSLLDRSSSQQGLNPLDGSRGVILGTGLLILAIIPRWAGVAQLLIDRSWRWRAETWLSLGMAGSSLLALVLLNSFNELWFSVSASGPLAATSAVGVGLAISTLRPRNKPPTAQILIVAAITAAAAFASIWWVWSSGASGGNVFITTQRWLGPVIGITAATVAGLLLSFLSLKRITGTGVVAGTIITLVFLAIPGRLLGAGSGQVGVLDNGIRNEWFNVGREDRAKTLDTVIETAWSGDQLEAAAWLRKNADPTDLIATNLTLSPFVAATTHLPTYISAIQYQYDYGTAAMRPETVTREHHSWDFINDPSRKSLKPLCDAGIKWLWVDPTRRTTRNVETEGQPTYTNSDVTVIDLGQRVCATSSSNETE